MNKFTLRIPDNLAKGVKELAKAKETTQTQIIREAIEFHLKQGSETNAGSKDS